MSLSVVILAAGQGKRMASKLPKVLHLLAGRPMLARVLDTAEALNAEQRIVVIGHGGEQVKTAFADSASVDWVEQKEQLGTGHALAQSFPLLAEANTVLVLFGDVPLVTPLLLEPAVKAAQNDRLGLVSVALDDPSGYGRVVRDHDGVVRKIVEHKDASLEELAIREINTGIICAPAQRIKQWVARLDNKNAQQEYYLTDVIEMAAADGVSVETIQASDPATVQGVNDRLQLAELERYFQTQQSAALMREGASLADPTRVDIRGHLTVGQDVFIDVNSVFEGQVHLADDVTIGPNCQIVDCTIGAGSAILANSVLEGVTVGKGASVGPFARIRPGTHLGDRAKIGNFVEAKNTVLGEGSKANHLSYLGDALIGTNVNVGAGTITCNYDGANKHKTVLEDDVFIGSNTALVAPIVVGEGATVGAGSTLSKPVDAKSLTLTRGALKEIKGWRKPVKKKPK